MDASGSSEPKRIATAARGIVGLRWWLVFFLFVSGLLLRLPTLGDYHREGDEVIYMSLVGQLESGHGYTLQKSPLVERGMVDRYQYDRPLFYHPPGGIGLFWLAYRVFGQSGYSVVQMGCFALFFWSMLFFAHLLRVTRTDAGLFLVALLSSFNPMMAHVTTKFWLDAPLLAFATLGAALFLFAWTKKSMALAIAAGIIVGYASLIKLTAFLILPGIFLVCIATTRPLKWKTLVGYGLCVAIPAVIIQTPWEIWQWMTVGSPFPQWAGKPSESLIRSNRYVYFLTVVRSPWVYLTTTPMVLTTIIPSALLLILSYARPKDDRSASGDTHLSTTYVRATALACLLWLSMVIAFHMALGFAGYSILLRYLILLAPASILLPSLLVPHFLERRSDKGSFVGVLERAMLVCSAVGVIVEVATGINAALHVQRALLIPFTGL